MQIVNQQQIAAADSLFRVGLERRVVDFEQMTWEQRLRLLSYDLWQVGLKIVVAAAILIVGRWIVRRLARGLDIAMNKWKIDPVLHTFIRTLFKTVLYFILLYLVIVWLGINTSLFVAMFAAAGLAIGMAMSGMFQNVAGGVMVLALKPFRCGDWIEIQGQAGKVMDIHLFTTVLRTDDNRTVMLPNGGVYTSIVTNHTSARRRRLEWPVSLNHNSDFGAAQKAIMELLRAEKKIHPDPAPVVVLNQITSDSIDLRVRAWVSTADYWDVYFAINAAIYQDLTDKGFDMGTLTAIKVSKDED